MLIVPILNRRGYQEILYVVAVISILAVTAIESYQVCVVKAHVISIIGDFYQIRLGSQVHYALKGEWPGRMADGETPGSIERMTGAYDVNAQNGAVSFTFKADVGRYLAGKSITLRPVIQADNPLGHVHWACGDKGGEPGWIIAGIDLTDLEDRYIPDSLK